MFSQIINRPELAAAALEVNRLLEGYSATNTVAKQLLQSCRPLLERAMRQEVAAPLAHGFFPPQFWEDGELFPLADLNEAVARFNLLLRGAKSVAAIREAVRKIEAMAEQDELELRKLLASRKEQS